MLPFAFTIFLSAFLLFQVQPIIARYILPWYGGYSSTGGFLGAMIAERRAICA